MSRRLARVPKTELLAEHAESNRAGRSISFRRTTLGAQIHAVLRRDIITGRLAPRAMLSEQDIAAGFGISRTPVREAMIKLGEEGLVEIFPQYGSFVAPIKLREGFDSQFAREALECAAVEKGSMSGRIGSLRPSSAASGPCSARTSARRSFAPTRTCTCSS